MANNRRHTTRSLTMRFSIIVVVAMYAAVVAAVGEDKTICDQDDFAKRAQQIPQGPQKPTLPPQYRVRIEGNIIESNYTQDIHEYFDSVNNLGAASEWIHGVEMKMLFLYPTGELITLQYDGPEGAPPRCHVDILDKSTAKSLFGLTQYSNGSDHIFSANQALRFAGGIPEVYIGRGTARDGIVVDMWESCIYSEPTNTTLKLTWSFSANNTWVTAENVVAPEQVDVTGIMHVNSSYSIPVLREYVFTDFQPINGPVADFETPPGTYCQNRVSTRPLPNVTNTFTFTAEIFEPLKLYLNWIKEYYDWDLNLVRYDYSVDPRTNSPYGNGKLIRVHDFNTGVAYVMDAMIGNCSVTPINATGFDAKSLDAGKVRIRTDKEFFFSNVPYEYAGQRVVRGINCDVWTARRVGSPDGYPNAISIWEWYFASSEWMENTGISNYFYLPVMLQVTSQAPLLNLIYNIYDYSEGNPNIWQTDISACFNYTNRKAFQLAFPGTYNRDVAANLSKFKFAVVSTIVALGGISPLRISNTQVDFSSGDVLVSFTILDKAPIAGDAATGFTDIPLADAVSAITNSVNRGQFQIFLDHASFPSAPGTLTAKKYSANSWDVVVNEYFGTPPKQGYSAGAMAGLGVAMVIIGLCIGFGILFGIYKIRGGSFTNSFSPKTFTEKEME